MFPKAGRSHAPPPFGREKSRELLWEVGDSSHGTLGLNLSPRRRQDSCLPPYTHTPLLPPQGKEGGDCLEDSSTENPGGTLELGSLKEVAAFAAADGTGAPDQRWREKGAEEAAKRSHSVSPEEQATPFPSQTFPVICKRGTAVPPLPKGPETEAAYQKGEFTVETFCGMKERGKAQNPAWTNVSGRPSNAPEEQGHQIGYCPNPDANAE